MSRNDNARLPIARYSNPLDEARLHQYERSSSRWAMNIYFTIIPFIFPSYLIIICVQPVYLD